jgi:hydrogenase maturation protease
MVGRKMTPRILIAGIGNIFFGDDAFGVEVAHRLMVRELPASVRVADFGIRGYDLAYALMDGYDVAILVDASPRGGIPGTVYTIEPDLPSGDAAPGQGIAPAIDGHSMDPMRVLASVKALGGDFKRVLVVGCEPESLGIETAGTAESPKSAETSEADPALDEFADFGALDEMPQGRMGLSAPVAAAVDVAVTVIESLVWKILAEAPGQTRTVTGSSTTTNAGTGIGSSSS